MARELFASENVRWKANWIWGKNDLQAKNIFFYFRKMFVSDGIPQQSMLHITADTEYIMWINGKEVGRGPVFCDPRWQSYDSYDVSRLVRNGNNVIAVLCYYYGEGTQDDTKRKHRSQYPQNMKRAMHDSRPGLLCQLELSKNGTCEFVATDKSWKSLRADAWQSDTAKIDDLTYSEIYYASKEVGNWKDPEYDDSYWEGVKILIGLLADMAGLTFGEAQSDCGHAHIFPWCMLEPRDIPHLRKRTILPKELVTIGEVIERDSWGNENVALRMSLEDIRSSKYTAVQSPESFIKKRQAEVVPFDHNISYDDFEGIRSATVIVDMGELLNGRVYIDIDGPAGGIIDIAYGQRLENGKCECYSSRLSAADRYFMKEGSQQWTSFGWRHFRYIQITFRRLSRPLTIRNIHAVADEYPMDEVGYFKCSDGILDWAWHAGVKDTRLCTYDRLFDCARERRQYCQHMDAIVLSTMAAFGDTAMLRRYFRTILRGQTVYGCICASNPTEYETAMLFGDTIAVFALWMYYKWFEDVTVIEEAYIPIKRHLEFLCHFRGEDGLIGEQPMSVWQDWADVEGDGNVKILLVNILHALQLQIAGWIARELSDTKGSDEYLSEAKRTVASINMKFWDEARGVFVDWITLDDRPCEHVSEHGNYAMMAYNYVNKERAGRIVSYLKNPNVEIGQISPALMMLLTDGLFNYGYADDAIDIMRKRYSRLMRSGMETTGELWSVYGTRQPGQGWFPMPTRCLAHGQSPIPTYALPRWILGINPLISNSGQIDIAPHTGGLCWAEGSVFTTKGKVTVRWNYEENKFNLTCALPKNLGAMITLPFMTGELTSVKVNETEMMPVTADVGGRVRIPASGAVNIRVILK